MGTALPAPSAPETDGDFDTASDGDMEVDTIAGQMHDAVLLTVVLLLLFPTALQVRNHPPQSWVEPLRLTLPRPATNASPIRRTVGLF